MTRRLRTLAFVATLAVALAGCGILPSPRPAPTPADSATIRDAITEQKLEAHLAALQKAADENGGNRAAGTPGYTASLEYVEGQLKASGYTTERQEFTYTREEKAAVTVQRTRPTSTSYQDGTDVQSVLNSADGTVTGRVTPVALTLGGDRHSASGCRAEDFRSFPDGDIALVQRGTCTFTQKVDNAITAGASAVVVLNQGDAPDREGLFDAGMDERQPIPVIATTFALGAAWASAPTELTVSVETPSDTITTWNLLADLPGDSDQTFVVGAHLDGVRQGPGINDNGSGVAAVLETAVQLGRLGVRPAHGVRFAFWGGEEDGLHGSSHYVRSLDDAGRRTTAGYLNVDMVGSPNPVPTVYGGGDWPAGSQVIEGVFTDFLTLEGTPPETEDIGASDHLPFAEAGIPVGGLYTGANEDKSAEEAERHGGNAEQPADPCYHQACDRVDAVDLAVVELMADAAAHATLTLAMDPEPLR